MVLPMILLYSFVFALEGGALAFYSASAARQVQAMQNQLRAFYAAENATEMLRSQVAMFYETNGAAPTDAQLQAMEDDVANEGQLHFSDIDVSYNGAAANQLIASGDFAGLNGSIREVNITAKATYLKGHHNANVKISQTLQIQQISLFQFGIFYDEDLEIRPGAAMTFAGPVHCNQDIYLSTGASMQFTSTLEAYGHIIHGYKDGNSVGVQTGAINIKDGSNVDQNMWIAADNKWLDYTHPDWLTKSQEHWDGNVKDVSHSVPSLKLPLPTGSTSRTLIVRRVNGESAEIQAQKMDYKGNIRIIDNAVKNKANTATLDFRYCSNSSGVVGNGPDGIANTTDDTCTLGSVRLPILLPTSTTGRSFTDLRENKVMKATEIDISLLKASQTFINLQAANPGGVIIYHSDQRNLGVGTRDALRLVNGTTLPTGGLTVATENPLYVKGNYNKGDAVTAKQPSGLVADVTTALSGSWDDTKSALAISNRNASASTINSAIVTGNKDTTMGVQASYNGGYENIIRFLESWSGVTFTYKGSTIVLYNSENSTGLFNVSGIYAAPIRAYSFDTDFKGANYAIPGFPSAYTIVKSKWEFEDN